MPTPEQHALLSASSASRWLRCTPSARLCEHLPERNTKYTEEGRLAHSLCELKVRKYYGIGRKTPMKPSEYKKELEKIKSNEFYDDEMEHCSEEYLQHIKEVCLRYPTAPYVALEQRVDYSDYAPGGFGTSDCIIIAGEDLHVIDYKHGKGVPVSAEDNDQLKLYALGALKRYKPFYPEIRNVILHIVQPRAGGISEWGTQAWQVVTWGNATVYPLAQKAFAGEGECNPGEKQCRFCGIRATCRARAEQAQNVTRLPEVGKLPPQLSNDEVGIMLTTLAPVVDWYTALKAYAEEALLKGEPIKGYKLVEGRTSRKWDDQEAAFNAFRAAGVDDSLLYERVAMSLSALEKKLGKKLFSAAASHIQKSPGKPTMVPESDKRKPYNSAMADFKDILEV